jgi:hypothetical protein
MSIRRVILIILLGNVWLADMQAMVDSAERPSRNGKLALHIPSMLFSCMGGKEHSDMQHTRAVSGTGAPFIST